MKILYSVTGAIFGGAVAHVLSLMRADVAAGHTVALVSAPEARLMAEAGDIGATVFPNPHFIRGVRLFEDVRALWQVFRAVRSFKPDIISAHSTKAGYAARLAGALLGRLVIFTAHGWPFADGRSWWQRWLLLLAEQLAARATAAIICVSDYDRQLALKYRVASVEKLVLVHNGVDPTPFLDADGEAIRQQLGLGNVPVLAMVGRLAHQKDPLTLLAACKLLKTDYRLLIVGDGELRGPVEEFVVAHGLRDRVIFTGERNDVPAIMAASDVLVLSSRWEGLPLVIIEAGFVGLPAVATGVGGVPELIDDGVTGYIVPPRDPRALAAAIRKLLGDIELCRRCGAAAREKALRKFTLNQMLTKTRRLYEDILSKSA